MKKYIIRKFLLLVGIILILCAGAAWGEEGSAKLRVGVTLHPYYSFVANVVGDRAEVVPLIGEGFNPHAYRPQPEDIRNMGTLDCLVVNGIGHDEFAFEILEASRMKGKIPLIYANDGVSLIPIGGTGSAERIVNPHTFISISASIRQIQNISKELQKLDSDNAKIYRENTRAYTRRLRKLKARYMQRIAELPQVDFRCATIHGGYDYILQEFGLEVTAVVEPNHGLQPTANQLRDTIDQIKELDVDVLFSEMDFPDKYVDTIEEATGVGLYHLSHMTKGGYSPDGFEKGMEDNMQRLTDALIQVSTKKADAS